MQPFRNYEGQSKNGHTDEGFKALDLVPLLGLLLWYGWSARV